MSRSLLVSLALAVALAGCAPTLSPPYRDYEVRREPPTADALTRQLDAAAAAAGWTRVPAETSRIVSTAPREVRRGLFATTAAALDLVPLDGGFVRVYVRAEKRSVLGGRTKVFALDGTLRRAILEPISEALAERGLVALGTPRDRDEDATE